MSEPQSTPPKIRMDADFINHVKCPECFEQVKVIEHAVLDEPTPRSHAIGMIPRSHIGYDLGPCGCFLSARDFTLVFRKGLGEGQTISFDPVIDCGCKQR